jgi:hypothetical protein
MIDSPPFLEIRPEKRPQIYIPPLKRFVVAGEVLLLFS